MLTVLLFSFELPELDRNQIYLALATLVVLGILFLSFYFSKKAIVKRKLKNAVVKEISRFRNGDIAKIVGKVEFIDEPLIAPLSKRQCSYYYVHIEEKISTGKSSHWRTIIQEENSSRFVIRDGNHCAFIQNKKVKSYIVPDRNYTSGFFEDATENLEWYLKKHGYSSEGLLGFNKRIKYTEGVLEQGEQVALLGRGEWKTAIQLGLPEHYDRVLVIQSPEKDVVYLSDDPDTVKKVYNRYQKSY